MTLGARSQTICDESGARIRRCINAAQARTAPILLGSVVAEGFPVQDEVPVHVDEVRQAERCLWARACNAKLETVPHVGATKSGSSRAVVKARAMCQAADRPRARPTACQPARQTASPDPPARQPANPADCSGGRPDRPTARAPACPPDRPPVRPSANPTAHRRERPTDRSTSPNLDQQTD